MFFWILKKKRKKTYV